MEARAGAGQDLPAEIRKPPHRQGDRRRAGPGHRRGDQGGAPKNYTACACLLIVADLVRDPEGLEAIGMMVGTVQSPDDLCVVPNLQPKLQRP